MDKKGTHLLYATSNMSKPECSTRSNPHHRSQILQAPAVMQSRLPRSPDFSFPNYST